MGGLIASLKLKSTMALLCVVVVLGYGAKHFYTENIKIQYALTQLQGEVERGNEAAKRSAKLLQAKVALERKLRYEVDSLKRAVKDVPNDGCLDSTMPDSILELLR